VLVCRDFEQGKYIDAHLTRHGNPRLPRLRRHHGPNTPQRGTLNLSPRPQSIHQSHNQCLRPPRSWPFLHLPPPAHHRHTTTAPAPTLDNGQHHQRGPGYPHPLLPRRKSTTQPRIRRRRRRRRRRCLPLRPSPLFPSPANYHPGTGPGQMEKHCMRSCSAGLCSHDAHVRQVTEMVCHRGPCLASPCLALPCLAFPRLPQALPCPVLCPGPVPPDETTLG